MGLTAFKFYLKSLYCMSLKRKTKWIKEENAWHFYDTFENIVSTLSYGKHNEDTVFLSSLDNGRNSKRLLSLGFYYNRHDLKNFIKFKTNLIKAKKEE